LGILRGKEYKNKQAEAVFQTTSSPETFHEIFSAEEIHHLSA